MVNPQVIYIKVQDHNDLAPLFNIRWIIYFEFAPEGTVDNSTFYVEVLFLGSRAQLVCKADIPTTTSEPAV
jgi:hypothetical protein